jgi:hypothetical protein
MNSIETFLVVLCGICLIIIGATISPKQLFDSKQYKIGDCFEFEHHFYEVIKVGNYGSLEAINYSSQVSNSAVWSSSELNKATKVDCFEMFEKKESK